MMTSTRMKELRAAAGLRQEDVAVLLGVGIATVSRWERPEGTLPTGLCRQVYEALDFIVRRGIDVVPVAEQLREAGSLAAVRWILNTAADLRQLGA